MQKLKQLYTDKHMLKELDEFYKKVADELILTDAHAGKDVSYAKHGLRVHSAVLAKMREAFEEKTEPKKIDSKGI